MPDPSRRTANLPELLTRAPDLRLALAFTADATCTLTTNTCFEELPNGRLHLLAWSGVKRSGTERNASQVQARVGRVLGDEECNPSVGA